MDFKLRVRHIVSWRGDIGRAEFLVWGLILFAIKYNLDRLIAHFFEREWSIADYLFVNGDKISVSGLPAEERDFYLALLIQSLPFIWFGTVLCVKRLRSAGVAGWLVIFFFIPFINLILFIVLSVLPERSNISEAGTSYIGRLIPTSIWGNAMFAVGIVLAISMFTTLFLIRYIEFFGWSVFVGIPFFLGFGSVLLYGYHKPIQYRHAFAVAMAATVCFGLITFILAVEGLICILMAFPIYLAVAMIGATLAYAIQSRQRHMSANAFLPVVLLIPAAGILEQQNSGSPPTVSVQTEIIINAPRQAVWEQLVAFSKIEETPELLFRAGIAYPTHAEIEGTGVGAIRRCNFTTGTFVEPITIWDEPNVLAFGVIDQPPPMIELSIYNNLELPHLDGYFKSEKGRFDLKELDGNRTLLTGTTWYHHDIWPSIYWKQWSDYILHRIHTRVLVHIKNESEKN